MMSKCYVFLVILFLLQQSQCEIYTALVNLEDLLHTEYALVNTLENYIKAEEQKLYLLKSYLNIYQQQQNKSSIDPQLYLENPLNAYTLIKRLTVDWSIVESLISTNANKDALKNITYFKASMTFPTNEDLEGAAVALIRLQDTYQLNTSLLATGELNGVQYSSELTAADCFELGKQSWNNEDFYHTRLWMEEALARLKTEVTKTASETDILDYLAISTYKEGDIHLALDLTKTLLVLNPDHARALKNKIKIEDLLKNFVFEENAGIKDEDGLVKTSEPISDSKDNDNVGGTDKDIYESLCRGEVSTPVEIQAKLKCKFVFNDNPFLKIAPFKVEEVHLDPDLFIFHNVISDNEINTIKSLSQKKFKSARVENFKNGKKKVSPHRICKVAWLKNDIHKYVADVSQRVEDMTGLTLTSAESLQVSNYGIGGHFDLHYDFPKKENLHHLKRQYQDVGNRVATVLFYMSDVTQGGATVFTETKTAIWPKKGTAAFWFNLFPSGDGDRRTRHAACPVLAGSKWISTKWIHEDGQEFRRPCSKERPPKWLTI